MSNEVYHAMGVSTSGLHLARRELAIPLLQQGGSAELGSGSIPNSDRLSQSAREEWMGSNFRHFRI